jgi:hypothetical protein
MITSLLLTFVGGIVYLIFSLLPRVTGAPSWWVDHVYPVMQIFSGLGTLPVFGTIMQITLIVLSTLGAWQGIVFLNWLYNKIRGSG